MAIISNDGNSMLSLRGDVSLQTAITLRADLEEIVRSHAEKPLCIDLSAMESVNSVVLSVLLCTLRVAEDVSCDLSYSNMSQSLFDVARVGGLESIIPIHK